MTGLPGSVYRVHAKAMKQVQSQSSNCAACPALTGQTSSTGLQSPEAQQLLAELARCQAIRLLASMDHVNAPLLWDRRTAACFNWLHFDVTTYAPYHAEAQEMPSLLIGRRCSEFPVIPCAMCLSLVHQSPPEWWCSLKL